MGTHKYYYRHLNDDLVDSHDQGFQLPEDYSIFPATRASKIWSAIVRPIARLISFIYIKLILHIHIVGKEKLKKTKEKGYFIYGNHTQAFGDVVLPLSIIPTQNYYAIGAQSNWGIPILGKLVLPYFGLPVGHTLKETDKLIRAINTIIKEKKTVVIYPEAHVWPYYTKIRPFSDTSMHFPVALKAPSFTMTTTYQQPKWGKRPRMVVYIDGPFLPNAHQNKKEAQQQLHAHIYAAMQKRAEYSNYEYCTYEKLV